MIQMEPIPAKMLDDYVGRLDAVIIDLRQPKAYRKSHVKSAVNIPYMEFEEHLDFPREKILIFYCERGGASMQAARQLAKQGYVTRSVIGGFEAYHGRNLVFFFEP